MAQFLLDDQLPQSEVARPLSRWTTVQRLRDLKPSEVVLDDRIPEILLTLHQPTFVTIDQGFWDRRLCHPKYCILYFALRDDQQKRLAPLLRALLRQPAFRNRKGRLGRVVRVSPKTIDSWRFQEPAMERLTWSPGRRQK
jgi:hypothetical protein